MVVSTRVWSYCFLQRDSECAVGLDVGLLIGVASIAAGLVEVRLGDVERWVSRSGDLRTMRVVSYPLFLLFGWLYAHIYGTSSEKERERKAERESCWGFSRLIVDRGKLLQPFCFRPAYHPHIGKE